MRTVTKGAILLAAACGLCFALSRSASADVVTPKSAYQPASVGLLKGNSAAAAEMPTPDKAVSDKAMADAAAPILGLEKIGEVAEPTPAPEQVVRPAAPSPIMQPSTQQQALSPVERLIHPLGTAFQRFQASLGRAVSACEVGLGSPTGGPVVVLAVLAVAIPFIRRRVIGTRWTADEDMRDLLYVWELTPPG